VNPVDTAERTQFHGLNDNSFGRSVEDIGIPVAVAKSGTPDWPYRLTTEAADRPMEIFDRGHVPDPLGDKAFDVAICLQA
jgi:hypothetical protein